MLIAVAGVAVAVGGTALAAMHVGPAKAHRVAALTTAFAIKTRVVHGEAPPDRGLAAIAAHLCARPCAVDLQYMMSSGQR
jgi:hypothetical protein